MRPRCVLTFAAGTADGLLRAVAQWLRAAGLDAADGKWRCPLGMAQVGMAQVGMAQVGMAQVGMAQVGLA